eukprot:3346712-Rhodomonas_salina.2
MQGPIAWQSSRGVRRKPVHGWSCAEVLLAQGTRRSPGVRQLDVVQGNRRGAREIIYAQVHQLLARNPHGEEGDTGSGGEVRDGRGHLLQFQGSRAVGGGADDRKAVADEDDGALVAGVPCAELRGVPESRGFSVRLFSPRVRDVGSVHDDDGVSARSGLEGDAVPKGGGVDVHDARDPEHGGRSRAGVSGDDCLGHPEGVQLGACGPVHGASARGQRGSEVCPEV